MQTRTYSLSDFADDYLGAEPGLDLAFVGPATSKVTEVIGSESHTAPLLATLVWQAFLRADGLREAKAIPIPISDTDEILVVRHPLRGGEPRHDLLVLVHDWPEGYLPRGVPARMSRTLIEDGWERMRDALVKRTAQAPGLALLAQSPEALVEAGEAQAFGIILAPAPELLATSAPTPALDVRSPQDAPGYSSAGVLVRRRSDGATGVTVALHTLADAAKDARVWIDDREGTVRSRDVITDSAFVELEAIDTIATDPRVQGVLRGLVPRNYEEVNFEGRGSGPSRTFVTGWTPELPLTWPDTQSRVNTEPDTVPGDSGAALLDSQGYVFGFAFRRTGYDQRPPFASWVWAESVLIAHDLELVPP
jgi:hypothetical protein